MTAYRTSLEAFFGARPDAPTFHQCPLHRDLKYLEWHDQSRPSVLVLQGRTTTRTLFSWLAPVIIDMIRVMKDNGEKVAFHCCQTQESNEAGDEPFFVISSILHQLLKIQPKMLLEKELYLLLKARLKNARWVHFDWKYALDIPLIVLTHIDRKVYLVLDRAHLIGGESKQFLESLAKLMVEMATDEPERCQVKLLLLADSTSNSVTWQKLMTCLREIMGEESVYRIERDQNDHFWKYKVEVARPSF